LSDRERHRMLRVFDEFSHRSARRHRTR
jgi:hypothetical protein